MKTVIHPLLAVGLFFTLSANKCAKPEPAATAPTNTITGPRWNLETIAGKAIRLPEGVENPYFGIADDGQLRGFGGCNQLMGSAKIDGSSLSFPGVGGTKKFCTDTQETENAFLKMLRATNSFRLDGNKLILLDKDKELATLTK